MIGKFIPSLGAPGIVHLFWWLAIAWLLVTAISILALRRLRGIARRRLALANGALVAWSLLTLFMLLEGGFYLLVDTTDGRMGLLLSRRWFERRVVLNELGVRGDPLPPATRAPGEIRILAVGDSIAFGQGIADHRRRWPELLEARLRAKGVDARVVNVSWMGWTTAEEHASIVKVAAMGVPFDQVVLGYCLNDIAAPVPPELARQIGEWSKPPRWLAPLVGNSLFLDWLRHRLVASRDPAAGKEAALLAAAFGDPVTRRRHFGELEALVAWCRENGKGLTVATFPYIPTDWGAYTLGGMHDELDAFWRAQGVRHVDLLEEYRRNPPASLIVGSLDAHPGPRGHEIAARMLDAALPPMPGR